MKLSVSIPDDLWQQATAVAEGRNPSHLVQDGLRRLVEDTQTLPSFMADRPADLEVDMLAIRDRLMTEARQEYQRGYRAGVDLARVLPWAQLDVLAGDFRFDIASWAAHIKAFGWMLELPSSTAAALEGTLGFLVADRISVLPFDCSPTYVRGVSAASRDVWEAVTEEGHRVPFESQAESPDAG